MMLLLCCYRLRDDYLAAMEGMEKHLLRYTHPGKLAFVGALHSMGSKSFRAEMVTTYGKELSSF
jgi:hypothetical protein